LYIETRRKTQCMQSGVNAIKRTCMAPYLMNHYLSKYFITIWCILFYRRHHTFDVKTCFQQNRYVFDVIVTSWALFVFCILWNFASDISTFSKKLSTSVVVHQKIFSKVIKINKRQILLKYHLKSNLCRKKTMEYRHVTVI
jgi:hypothetical protein